MDMTVEMPHALRVCGKQPLRYLKIAEAA